MAIKGIQRTGFSCVADASGLCPNGFAIRVFLKWRRLAKFQSVCTDIFSGNIQAVIHFTD
jgi:hypothetical protein